MGVIYLASDFGLQDPYVGIMKSRISIINQGISIIDLSHQLRPFDLEFASWFLLFCYLNLEKPFFLGIVVDPGVGTERKCIVVKIDSSYIVLPDNGILTLLVKSDFLNIKKIEYFQIDFDQLKKTYLHIVQKKYKLDYIISSTFHGRDIFAPALALIKKDRKLLYKFTKKIKDVLLINNLTKPIIVSSDRNNIYKGKFIYYDIFGNLFTNFYIKDKNFKKIILKILENNNTIIEIPEISITFNTKNKYDFLFYQGSFGFLEVAKNQGSAFLEWKYWDKIKKFDIYLEVLK